MVTNVPYIIFVFYETDNSYFIARRISEAIGVGMVDITAVIRYKCFGYDAGGEDVDFGFPMYYYGLPAMVKTLAENLVVCNLGRVFCVATCGEESVRACEMLVERLEEGQCRRLPQCGYA